MQGNPVRAGVCAEPVPACCLFRPGTQGSAVWKKGWRRPVDPQRCFLVPLGLHLCAGRTTLRGLQGRWWRGALLGAGPRLLAPDSAPSGRVAVDVPPCRAWPPAVRKASEGSVLKFHSIMCSALSPKADCYSSRRGGNSPGLWRLPSAIKY